ncbi:MAG: T9SS type A sorting domain-containing protein [Gemmatimonadota bacterium]|nr:T9SS type A sorting domain-containing protein [Gemmatimonadota bacterium]MDP7030801.1 T9SS type A sorting domain-containing protein [Gemmatimonadota bacterium]
MSNPDGIVKGITLSAWPVPYTGGNLQISFGVRGNGVSEEHPAELALYDADGRRVCTLVRDIHQDGVHATTWNGASADGGEVPAGVYYLRFETFDNAGTMKVIVER